MTNKDKKGFLRVHQIYFRYKGVQLLSEAAINVRLILSSPGPYIESFPEKIKTRSDHEKTRQTQNNLHHLFGAFPIVSRCRAGGRRLFSPHRIQTGPR